MSTDHDRIMALLKVGPTTVPWHADEIVSAMPDLRRVDDLLQDLVVAGKLTYTGESTLSCPIVRLAKPAVWLVENRRHEECLVSPNGTTVAYFDLRQTSPAERQAVADLLNINTTIKGE